MAAITGPATPYSIEMIQQATDVEMHPNMVHSCIENSGEYADPSVRIQQWVQAFGDHGLLETICAPSFAPSLMLIATALGKLLGPQCIENDLVDTDITTPDIDPQCQITDIFVDSAQNTVERPLPACASNGNTPPCWSIHADPQCMGATLLVDVNRTGTTPENGLSTQVSCALCDPGVAAAGCPCIATDVVAGCK